MVGKDIRKLSQHNRKDKGKNKKPVEDIGLLIKKEIIKKSEELGIEVNLKYMDPTYSVRAVPANSYDCNLCSKLAECAVHCAFAGFTNFCVGMINNKPCMIPISKLTSYGKVRQIELDSEDYLMMLASTGQPSFYHESSEKENLVKVKDDKKDVHEEKSECKEESKEDKKKKVNDNMVHSPCQSDEEEDDDNKEKIFNFS